MNTFNQHYERRVMEKIRDRLEDTLYGTKASRALRSLQTKAMLRSFSATAKAQRKHNAVALFRQGGQRRMTDYLHD